jgi:hypothetical protein
MGKLFRFYPGTLTTMVIFASQVVQTEFGSPGLDQIHAIIATVLLVSYQIPAALVWLLIAISFSSVFFSALLLHGTYLFSFVGLVAFALNPEDKAFLRKTLFLAYFFAFFQKLNFDFLNPEVSCAVRLLELWPELGSFKEALPYLALGMEGFMAFGLLHRRTAPFALITALIFHLTILPADIFAMPLNLLVLATGFYHSDRITGSVPVRIIYFLLMAPFIIRKFAWASGLPWNEELCDPILRICTAIVLVFFIFLAWSQRKEMMGALEQKTPLWQKGIFAFLILWGLQPYLGLNTMQSFTMESNLRTEENPNHLVLRAVPQIFDFQKDLMTWNEYRDFLKDCPDNLIVLKPFKINFAQSGPIPYGAFEKIPRLQAERILEVCKGRPLGLKRFIHFRAVETPSQCRN